MRERCEISGGEVHLDSKVGKGTWLNAILPTQVIVVCKNLRKLPTPHCTTSLLIPIPSLPTLVLPPLKPIFLKIIV